MSREKQYVDKEDQSGAVLQVNASTEQVKAYLKKHKTLAVTSDVYFISPWVAIAMVDLGNVSTALAVSLSGIQGALNVFAERKDEIESLRAEMNSGSPKQYIIDYEDYPGYLYGDVQYSLQGTNYRLSEQILRRRLCRLAGPSSILRNLIDVSLASGAWAERYNEETMTLRGNVASVLAGDFVRLVNVQVLDTASKGPLHMYKVPAEIFFAVENIKCPQPEVLPHEEHYALQALEMTSKLLQFQDVTCTVTSAWHSISEQSERVSLLHDNEHLRGSLHFDIDEHRGKEWLPASEGGDERARKAVDEYIKEKANRVSLGVFLAAAKTTEPWCNIIPPEDYMCPMSDDYYDMLQVADRAGTLRYTLTLNSQMKGQEGAQFEKASLKWVMAKNALLEFSKANKLTGQVESFTKVRVDGKEYLRAGVTVKVVSVNVVHEEEGAHDDNAIDFEICMEHDVDEEPVQESETKPEEVSGSDTEEEEEEEGKEKDKSGEKDGSKEGEAKGNGNGEKDANVGGKAPDAVPQQSTTKYCLIHVYLNDESPQASCGKVPNKRNVALNLTDLEEIGGKLSFRGTAALDDGTSLAQCRACDSLITKPPERFRTEWEQFKVHRDHLPWQQVRVLHPTLDALKKQYYSIMPRIILPPRNVTKKAVERKTTKTAYRESISLPPPDAEKMTAFNYDSLPLHSNMFSKTNTAPKELVKKSTIISENNHLLPAMCRWLFFCFHKSGHKDVPRTLYIRRNKDGSYNIHTYCMALQQDEEFRRGFDNGTMKNPYVHTFVYLLTLYAITMPVWEGDQEDTMQTLRYERVCGSNFVCPMPELILKDGELFAYFVKGMESSSRRQKEKLRSLENVKKLYTPKSIGRLPARIHKGGGVLKMGRDRECADLLCRTLFMAHSGLPVTGTFYTWYTHPYERLAVIYLYTLKNLWAATLAGCSDDFRSVWKYENRDSLFKKSVDLWDTVITLIMDGIAANKAVPEDTSLFKVSFDLKTVLGHPGELKARVWATDFETPVAPLDPYVAEYTWEVDVNLVLAKARQKHGTQFAQQKA
eukprot:TRINITY_DN14611_c0_g2_i5.p1 TRINITY_DN14611_c0_g2~~TRINITY_DN14611_c0_g2_i5.p1  ORF type:complete len:1056 (+),score=389.40 TRINITY_DN14611_c0_g2_i5:33-3170(+)